jgi:hypothetical protein
MRNGMAGETVYFIFSALNDIRRLGLIAHSLEDGRNIRKRFSFLKKIGFAEQTMDAQADILPNGIILSFPFWKTNVVGIAMRNERTSKTFILFRFGGQMIGETFR